jgi:hypothetical protein
MAAKVNCVTIDLTAYPDSAVIYLGMLANSPRGLKTVGNFESLETWARSMPLQPAGRDHP